jgi:hypothetical protein
VQQYRCKDKLKDRIAWIEKIIGLPGNANLSGAAGVLQSANQEIGVPRI